MYDTISYFTTTTKITKRQFTTNNFFVCMKMSLLSIIHDLRRFKETDRKEKSLRFGWIMEEYEEIGRGL